MRLLSAILVWAGFGALVGTPIFIAAASPLLQWRDPVYVVAGFAGIAALALLLVQPVLIGGYLPGLPRRLGRHVHRWTGSLLVVAVIIHVTGLWLTSPPDVIDALIFASPTPFAAWGVVAMWAVFAAAMLALLRRRLRSWLSAWRLGHSALVLVAVVGTVIHAVLIEGTMGMVSKAVLCAAAIAAVVRVIIDLRTLMLLKKPQG